MASAIEITSNNLMTTLWAADDPCRHLRDFRNCRAGADSSRALRKGAPIGRTVMRRRAVAGRQKKSRARQDTLGLGGVVFGSFLPHGRKSGGCRRYWSNDLPFNVRPRVA